jgi:chromosomal replication initiator protein
VQLKPSLTFDRYVAPASDAVAPAICRALAAGDTRYQCVFLYGPPGVGKTHLLHAMAHSARERQSGASVVLITATDLMESLVGAVRHDTLRRWREGYERADLLLVDDFRVFATRPQTQAELDRLFGSCLDCGRAVACAATCRRRQLPEVAACLPASARVRFLALTPPSRAHLGDVVAHAANEWGLTPPSGVVTRIARQAHGDVRTALGALRRWQLLQEMVR